MSFAEVLEELPALSVRERQILIRRALDMEDLMLSSEEASMVGSRLADHHKDPASSLSLGEFKKRLRNGLGTS